MADLVRHAFRRWVDAQDVPATLVATEPKSWVAATAGAFFVVALAAWVPAAHEFSHLDARAALLGYIPALLCSSAMYVTRPSRTTLGSHSWVILIFGVTMLQFWAASLITWSKVPGAAVFSSIFLFTAGFHGHLHRVTLTEPFLAIGTLAGSLIAAALNRDAEHIAIFSVVIPAALSVELLAGTIAARADRDRAESDRLRAAVNAQIMDQREQEVSKLSQTLVEVLGANHDVNNSVMSAQLAAEDLAAQCEGNALPPPSALRETISDLVGSLIQIRSIVERVRVTGKSATSPETEVVEVGPVLENVVGGVSARFPDVMIVVGKADQLSLRVAVRGGSTTLHRILHNLVLNACEGNGTERATQVEISAARNESGAAVDIFVDDDGPGFPPASLTQPIEGFATSKKDGTGLGLYTTERLVRASGGNLVRANRTTGGARLQVTLPLERA